LSDTKGYLGGLFGGEGPFQEADFEALTVISLVERCGVIGNVFSELEQLCALVKLNPKDVRERLHRMQKANGLVARAGRSVMSETFFMLSKLPLVAGQPSSIQSRNFKAWASDLGISSC
jgi:hypothetical protein